jgi:hypothetical protein
VTNVAADIVRKDGVESFGPTVRVACSFVSGAPRDKMAVCEGAWSFVSGAPRDEMAVCEGAWSFVSGAPRDKMAGGMMMMMISVRCLQLHYL